LIRLYGYPIFDSDMIGPEFPDMSSDIFY
jgi:hypothetical protein